MGNVLLDESRDARLAVNLSGFCEKLRVPETLHRLVMSTKPDHVSLGTHTMTALLNDAIDTLQSRRDYRGIYGLLGTVLGFDGDIESAKVPGGTNGDGRHLR